MKGKNDGGLVPLDVTQTDDGTPGGNSTRGSLAIPSDDAPLVGRPSCTMIA